MKYLLETQQRLLALYGQTPYSKGDAIPYNTIQMRKRLIMEETHELLDAINDFSTMIPPDELRAHFLKEFADTLVVLFGTAAQLGFTDEELEEAYDIVHIDNMSKAYYLKEDAQIARDYYDNHKHGEFHVKTITMPSSGPSLVLKGDSEFSVEPIQLIYYAVTNEEGKIMKRYPAPSTTDEERIYQYIAKQNTEHLAG